MQTVVILNDVRSVHNVGSIFRTADAAGVKKIYLTGVTATPIDRFGRARRDLAKTALGAEKTVPWEYLERTIDAIEMVRRDGYEIVGAEIDPRAQDFRGYAAKKPVAIVLGSEVDGLSDELRAACDALVQIPMRGSKESLNVSVAAGILLFALFNN